MEENNDKALADKIAAKKLTKKQRHNIYKEALRLFRKERGYLCHSLDEAITGQPRDVYDGEVLGNIMRLLPEFAKKKPKETFTGSAWFDTDKAGAAKRIQILMACIKQTE